jgi:hypothetical protein
MKAEAVIRQRRGEVFEQFCVCMCMYSRMRGIFISKNEEKTGEVKKGMTRRQTAKMYDHNNNKSQQEL